MTETRVETGKAMVGHFSRLTCGLAERHLHRRDRRGCLLRQQGLTLVPAASATTGANGASSQPQVPRGGVQFKIRSGRWR